MKRIIQTIYHSLIGTVGTGVILLLASEASAQNLFISDYQDGDIYEYTSGGVQSTFATGLESPTGLAFDSAGDLFAADQGRGSIYEFINNNGSLSSTPTLFASGLNLPTGLAFDAAGNLFVANAGENNIIKITTSQVQSTFTGGLSNPWGLAFSGGNLFVGNVSDGDITEITPGGSQSTFATGLNGPGIGLAFNNAGNLFVGNISPASITEITPGGSQSTFASTSEFSGYPNAIAFNNAGELVTSESKTPDLLVFTSNGTLAQTIDISGAQDLNGLAFQPVPEPKLIEVLAAGGTTIMVATSLRKYKTLSAEIRSK